MLLTHPNALWGLLAIAIPVLLHLFNLQRYQKVYFTNVRFLRQLQLQAKKQSRMRHLLVLLSRVMVIAMLVAAFAKPYLPPKGGQKAGDQEVVGIYIDNSLSMGAGADNLRLLELAKKQAEEVVKSSPRTCLFSLVTNDLEGRHHHLYTADEFHSNLEAVDLTPIHRTIGQVLRRQVDLIRSKGHNTASLYFFSDFQRNMAVVGPDVADTNMMHYFVPLQAQALQNISLDSCWFSIPVQQPGQVAILHMKLTNHSGERYEKIPVKLIINGSQRTLASADLDANSSQELTLAFTIRETGIHHAHVEISDFPVTFDNRLYFSFNVLPVIKVLSVYDRQPNAYMRTLFTTDSLFQYGEAGMRQINYSLFSTQQLIVLNGLSSITSGLTNELVKFVNEGGHLLVIPCKDADLPAYRILSERLGMATFAQGDTTRNRLTDLNLLHPVYNDVFERDAAGKPILPPETDLPWVGFHWMLQIPPRSNTEVVVRLENGRPFLVSTSAGEGTAWLIASPLEKEATNFPVHALFVPTLHKIALLSMPRQPLYYIIGQTDAVMAGTFTPAGNQVFRLRSTDNHFEFIPGHRVVNFRTWIYALERVKAAGNYSFETGEEKLSGMAFNFDRRESVQDYLSEEELSQLAANAGITNFAVIRNSSRPIGHAISEMNLGKQLWKHFIIAALFFLLLEGVALRFLR